MTAIHCAAQRYEGVLSIFIFSRQHAIDVKAVDVNGATALHVACVSGLIQNVQTLLKLGANPNAQDQDGNTCLHLCILQMLGIKKTLNEENQDAENGDEKKDALDHEGFEILKNTAKELLFSGCSRDVENGDGNTARDIFEANIKLFSDREV